MRKTRLVRGIKTAMITSVAVSGATIFGSCGVANFQDSVQAGIAQFLTDYTADALFSFAPEPGSVLGGDDENGDE